MESKFLSVLITEEIDDDKAFLVEPLVYQSAILDGKITVPKKFVTDFASVPRLPLAFWLCGGRAKMESVVHDYLYQTHLCGRKTADKVLLEAMTEARSAINPKICELIYLGVRLGGYLAYRSGPKRFELFGNNVNTRR